MKDNHIPSWEECHAQGMTAPEAAAARGVLVQAARDWSSKNGTPFVSVHSKKDAAWRKCHDAGKTAPEAARALGKSVWGAHSWALRRNLKWPPGKRGRKVKSERKVPSASCSSIKSKRVQIIDDLTPQEAEDCELLEKVMRYSWPERFRAVKRPDLAKRWEALCAGDQSGNQACNQADNRKGDA